MLQDNSLDVIGLGLSTLDVLIRLDQMPTWEKTAPFERIAIDGGGPAATAVAAASRLGLRAGFVGTAGTGDMGQRKLESLRSCGVDVSRVVLRQSEERQIIICLVRCSDGERTFWGKAGLREEELREDELDTDYIRAAAILHLDGFNGQAALAAARMVREAGGTVVLDCHQGGRVSDRMKQLIEISDVAIGGSDFLTGLMGTADVEAAAVKALGLGPRIVAQTQGDRGVYGATRDEFVHVPAFQVDAVDTTGAGDVFHGACLLGIRRGWSLRTMLTFASAVSAIVCSRMGGRCGAPTFDETMSFLAERHTQLQETA